MKFTLGTKEEMSQIFTEEGKAVPVTVVHAGPATVTALKTKDTDGYSAVQLGFGEKRASRISKALRGHFAKSGKENHAHVVEFRLPEGADPQVSVGDTISATELFTEGDKVQISGITKGKGFQGGVKRHGFAGGPGSHGQKHTLRAPGSIGATGPNRVFKGRKMAGRMGGDRVTVKSLKVVGIDAENDKLFISGAVPGRRGTLLEVRAK